MGKRHLPSIEALTEDDDDLLIAELKVREVREHIATARTLLDAVDELSASQQASFDEQGEHAEHAAEELARLGCKIVELASALRRARLPESTVTLVQRAS